MLQNEHIEFLGSFKLDYCAAVPMLQAFVGRLDGFKFMLANKIITLHNIEDLAQVVGACPSALSRPRRISLRMPY